MIVDCNVSLGHWPFQYAGIETARQLEAHLKREGIGRALVSSADAVLFPEPEECNARLRKALAGCPSLTAIPVLNPRTGSAPEILATAELVAVKLIPNYHGYSLTDPRAIAVCRVARQRRVAVMVQMRMEAERGHSEFLKMPGVSVDDITALAAAVPDLSLVALCPYLAEAVTLAKLPGVFVDISFTENPDTLAKLCAQVPAERVLFGSHTPWYYTGAAMAKLTSSEIGERERTAIGSGNAVRLLGLTV